MNEYRRFGWKRDNKDAERELSALRLSATALPASSTLVDEHVRDLLYQDNSSSCLAQALAQAIRTRLSLQGGMAPVLPSRRGLYRLSREVHGAGDEDDGTFSWTMYYAVSKLGWCDEKHLPWPTTDEQMRRVINSPVDSLARYYMSDQVWSIEDYAITSSDPVRDTKVALVSGYPLTFGINVDEPFLSVGATTQVVEIRNPQKRMGHGMMVSGYDEEAVIIVNSWRRWGNDGRCRLGWNTFRKHARDIRAVRAVRKPTA